MTPIRPRAAVLTGDIVGSTKAGPEATGDAIERLARTTSMTIAHWPGMTQPLRFDQYRGDGWQVLLTNPAQALRATLVLVASVRSAPDALQTRICIGIGPVDPPVSPGSPPANGEAFVTSGRALESLPRSRLFAIDGDGVTDLHRAVIVLAEHLTNGWTREQAEAAFWYLRPSDPPLAEIARILGISTQAVSYRVRGAGARNLRDAVNWWERSATEATP